MPPQPQTIAVVHHGTGQKRSIDYSMIGIADTLRGLVRSGLSDEQIAAMAGCCEDTVQTWRTLFGIRRYGLRPRRRRLSRNEFREITARVHAVRFGQCWDRCPHLEAECDGEFQEELCVYTRVLEVMQ